MKPTDLIAARRDGRPVPGEDLADFIRGIGSGKVPDYQASAWLMASYIRGLSAEEVLDLVIAMRDSGTVLRWPDDPRPLVDKHSTGGVGDKASLIVAPLAASLGMRVPMISGRGLGHTGGTLDKLESIPGFRTRLATPEFQELVGRIGFAMCGQTGDLAPADRVLYSLRDATSTVDSIPLICASILSKKLAEGTDALVFDVKQGRGAFMRSEADALDLASMLVGMAGRAGCRARALVTGMDFLLGMTAGNALEVRESIEVLRGRGPRDVRDLSIALVSAMLEETSTGGADQEAAAVRCSRALDDGSALLMFERMVEAQGGDLAAFGALPPAAVILEVTAARSGLWSGVDGLALGEAVRSLGAGRYSVEDRIDYSAGWEQLAAAGTEVRAGQALGRIHASGSGPAAQAAERITSAFVWDEPVPPLVRRSL